MTARKIRLLDTNTINKIAAGEVVENSTSVVKELIENALDGEATHIEIVTQAAGRGLIRVSDNGVGMGPDDLLLSLERHATSKIAAIEDLIAVETMGFRGEALSSIAAVSKMTLHSALHEKGGYSISIEGGKIGTLQPLARLGGTTVEVRSLFFNTPVRKKFQKNPSADLGDIHKLLTRFALCHPHIGFTWINDEEEKLHVTNFSSFPSRIEKLLGKEISQHMLSLEHQAGDLNLQGVISTPMLHRPNRSGQYLFLNQRVIDSMWFSQQVLASYSTRLPPNRYPFFILHFQLPPEWVDVNVHPQKKEVRMQQEERMSPFIRSAIDRTLSQEEGKSAELPPKAYHCVSAETLSVAEPQALYNAPIAPQPTLWQRSLFTLIARLPPYLLLQEEEGIRIVHSDRALARIAYETLCGKKEVSSIQTLLLPIQLDFNAQQREVLNPHLEKLNHMGISIRPFGGATYIIDAIPSVLEREEMQEWIEAYLEEGEVPIKMDRLIKKRTFNKEMAEALLHQLFSCPSNEYTPDGKPIHRLLQENNLEILLT